MSNFVHLHLHSQYSLLDGANKLDDVVRAAQEAGMPGLALTDHGNMYGAIEFYDSARAAGINPIIGIEAYVAQGSHLERDPQRASSNHLVLLARNLTGFQNLLKLTTRSFLEGFYYKPRIDHQLLEAHSEGLICLSACLKGEVNEAITQQRTRDAEAIACKYRDLFGAENFFLELQDHGIEEQKLANIAVRKMARSIGVELVATNDCHYLRQEDAFAHDILLCIGTQKTLADPNRLKYASEEFYFKTADDMFAIFPRDAKAIENTLGIEERCKLDLPRGKFHLPEFPVPEGQTVDSFFENVVRERFARRRSGILRQFSEGKLSQPIEVYEDRLATEIEIIRDMGFSGYFLITWDFCRFASEQGIPVGPGRGSAAGSLVSYLLGITDIDPLRYGLLFERFLNPERISMPDIDIDFCMRRRGEVIHYVNEKYGRDHVAQIITFGSLAAKAVIRDVGRVLGLPYAKVDRMAKLIPDMTRSLAQAAREVKDLAREANEDADVRQIVEVGSRLEGLKRHQGVHAAGVVITPQPIEELVPLCKTNKDEIITQWDKDIVENLGLLKVDFLGLRTLTVIDDAIKLLSHQGIELDLETISLEDEDVFALFSEGRTTGIFQFESSGMRDLLRRARPTKFEDLVAFNALYRPGALSVGMVKEFILRKRGERKVKYILEETRPILEETYGVIAYQEQVMQIAVEVAGFTLGEADILRKAMGKKKAGVMAEQKIKFVRGADRKGINPKKAAELWEYIEPFAGYGFNKSHSVAYALLAYRTAYLKAHYPVAFMAAMLTSEMSSKDNVGKYIQECREMGIEVLPPDINSSSWSFTIAERAIQFGLGAVKGVGEAAVESILEARRRMSRFRSLSEFAVEVDLKTINHKALDSLVRSGAFDSFGFSRAALAVSLDSIVEYAQARRRERDLGQGTLFAPSELTEPEPDSTIEEWSEGERLQQEKEALGFFLTGNPLTQYKRELDSLATHSTSDLRDTVPDGKVSIGGIITRLRRVKIKNGRNAGRMMGRFVLEDLEGSIPATLFADALQRFEKFLSEGSPVVVTAQARDSGSEVELTVEDVKPLETAGDGLISVIELTLTDNLDRSTVLKLRELLLECAGPVAIRLRVRVGEEYLQVDPSQTWAVRFDGHLERLLKELLGPENVETRLAN